MLLFLFGQSGPCVAWNPRGYLYKSVLMKFSFLDSNKVLLLRNRKKKVQGGTCSFAGPLGPWCCGTPPPPFFFFLGSFGLVPFLIRLALEDLDEKGFAFCPLAVLPLASLLLH